MGSNKSGRQVKLFSPLKLRAVIVSNRIMISPMCQYCAKDAIPHDWHFTHLASRAVGGAGIVMTEAVAVEPVGRITPYDVGLWSDEQEAAFGRIASFISEQGTIPGLQLAHAGRKASRSRPWEDRRLIPPSEGGWSVVGPSPVPWELEAPVPKELTTDDIARLTATFQHAAERALRAGFRLIELHAAHGYLLHSFLSPLTNHRQDGYGGSFQGRTRFLIEVVNAVREAWPADLPFFVRLSAIDWVSGGWELEDTVSLARILSGLGVDAIDCSSGGIMPEADIKPHAGYQVPFAESVRRETGVRTVAVGMISQPAQAEDIIVRGQADLVAIGRLALWDPYWPHHAAKKLQAKVLLPKQYERANIFN
ncbi:MAG: NADH:flavin oxidoreductase/NADH oxidase [Desulfobacterales bacterium]|nr:NADH:flavin oxidoreductase/NADH oxidase [Desulfobacterales bacterium]